jgi:hypothetical protein
VRGSLRRARPSATAPSSLAARARRAEACPIRTRSAAVQCRPQPIELPARLAVHHSCMTRSTHSRSATGTPTRSAASLLHYVWAAGGGHTHCLCGRRCADGPGVDGGAASRLRAAGPSPELRQAQRPAASVPRGCNAVTLCLCLWCQCLLRFLPHFQIFDSRLRRKHRKRSPEPRERPTKFRAQKSTSLVCKRARLRCVHACTG